MKPKETNKNKAAVDTKMNIKDIESLIKFVQSSGVAEVSLEQKDFKITIKTTHGNMVIQSGPPVLQSSSMAQAPFQSASSDSQRAKEESKYLTIKSPMIGT